VIESPEVGESPSSPPKYPQAHSFFPIHEDYDVLCLHFWLSFGGDEECVRSGSWLPFLVELPLPPVGNSR
jgi:hypothetical protein